MYFFMFDIKLGCHVNMTTNSHFTHGMNKGIRQGYKNS